MVKKKNLRFSEVYRRFVQGDLKLERYQWLLILLLVIVLAGFVGWVWEFLLQEFAGGFRYLYIKGGNLLPWLNLYAYGAVLIMLVSYRLRRYPWAVFLTSAVACGLLELFAGWVVYTVGNGTRYWDYTNSWFGWGNINGFVCPASAVVFGIAALLLMYFLVPFCAWLAKKMTRRSFSTLVITLFVLVIVDDVVNLTLKNLGLPTAQNFYEWLGWRFK